MGLKNTLDRVLSNYKRQFTLSFKIIAMTDIKSFKNPLRFIIRIALTMTLIIAIAYLVFIGLASTQSGGDLRMYSTIAEEIKYFGIGTFNFLRPFLQLVIILILVEWLLGKFNTSLWSSGGTIVWNIQTVIGLIIIAGFTLAALAGINGVANLKEIALVVVGFYFGTQRKSIQDDNISHSKNEKT